MRAEVAAAALAHGARMVNDVSGGRADPNMAALVADAGVPWILMHWRSVSAARPHDVPEYGDVVADVKAELLQSVDAATTAAWTRREWSSTLVSVSPRRHNTIGRCCGRCPNSSRPGSRCWSVRRASASWDLCWPTRTACDHRTGVKPRLPWSPRLAAWHGVWGVRVHDVRASVDALEGGRGMDIGMSQ